MPEINEPQPQQPQVQNVVVQFWTPEQARNAFNLSTDEWKILSQELPYYEMPHGALAEKVIRYRSDECLAYLNEFCRVVPHERIEVRQTPRASVDRR